MATLQTPQGPNRHQIEHLVRRAVYRRMGLSAPRSVEAPNPLVVNSSARHCHLTQEAVEALFGPGHELTPMKWLYQEGQYAAKETVTLIGPRSKVISNLRILGPCRTLNQVELAFTDARALGFDIPVRLSGKIEGTPGCMLMGPKGFFEMPEGVIRAGIHAHLSPEDARFYGVEHEDLMKLRVHGPCQTVFEKVLARIDPAFKLEVHMDTDEANGCGLNPTTFCELFV